MEDAFIAMIVLGILFIGLPWLVLHYVTKWKSAQTLPVEDERLLDDLYEHARRLEERLHTIERIITADDPNWRPRVRHDQEDEALLSYRKDRSN